MVIDAFFYIFAAVTVLAAACVIIARNPVHAVLFLILAFFSAAGLFVLLGAEFLAMLLVVVYVGAVAVLFLFVVMMLDVDFDALKAGFVKNAPLGLLIGGIVAVELVMMLGFRALPASHAPNAAPIPDVKTHIGNTTALGQVIYTNYAFLFEVAGLILLVSMIGAIVLTLTHKPNIKRQSISEQVNRNPKLAVEMTTLKSGEYRLPEKPSTASAPTKEPVR